MVLGGRFLFCSTDPGVITEDDLPNDNIPPATPFVAGETFSTADFPYRLTEVGQLTMVAGYSGRTGYKAFAMTQDLDIYIVYSNEALVEDQTDSENAIVERCEIRFMKPCSLLVSGDVYAQNQGDFENNFVFSVVLGPVFDATFQVPGAINYWQNIQSQNYPDFDPGEFKAMALNLDARAATGFSNDNQEEANRRAMEVCESARNSGCVLMAAGANIVLDLNNYQFSTPSIQYAPNNLDIDRIPFISDRVRELVRTEYALAAGNGFNYALVMDRYGFHARDTQATPFTDDELQALVDQFSASINVQDRTCFVYSVDGQIVMTRDAFERAQFPGRFQ